MTIWEKKTKHLGKVCGKQTTADKNYIAVTCTIHNLGRLGSTFAKERKRIKDLEIVK